MVEWTDDGPADAIIRNWWLLALRGVAALLFGVLAMLRPGLTLAVLVLLFGAYAIAYGVFAIVAAISRRLGEPQWGWLLLNGVLSVGLGILTFFTPGVTTLGLLYLIAAWAIITGASEIATAVRLRRVITGEWVLILAGALSVLFGLFLVVFPGAGALALALWIGTYAVVLGILLVGLGLRLRSWGNPSGLERRVRAT